MYFFTAASTGHLLYCGKDKFENEDLIRYGLPEDVWFHVDSLSSAHVYLRMNRGEKLKELPEELIKECCHLVKANSIEGCKLAKVKVVYTRWQNLKKTPGMEPGQVGFKDESRVHRIWVEKCNAIVNDLNRTKKEEFPDLAALQEERAAEMRAEARKVARERQLQEKEAKKKSLAAKKLREYDGVFVEEKMEVLSLGAGAGKDSSSAVDYEDDFM
ncbi:unnamed protein product [Chrysoparadoxa australica]